MSETPANRKFIQGDLEKLPRDMPKNVKVHPFEYAVQGMSSMVDTENNEKLSGTYSADYECLYVDTSIRPMQVRDTLLHEILHTIIGTSTLRKQLTEDEEEAIVHTITPRLLGVLRDNPKLVSYLCGK